MVKVRCTACVGRVRLVRACGSKRFGLNAAIRKRSGQARKSLWIETFKSSYKIFILRRSGS